MSKKLPKKPAMFAGITKVDEAARTVTGRMVQEVPDKVGEIFDYATSKPHFERWSKSFKDATGGKSLGNVRAMHGPVAAGKVTALDFVDAEKAMDIVVKVVDDKEWAKVLEGVYTGFSIGGKYVGQPIQEGDLMRYTAAPDEVSLVDNPCVPTASFFEVHKADGSLVKTMFKAAEGTADTSGEDKSAEDAKKRGTAPPKTEGATSGDEGTGHAEPDGDEGKAEKPGSGDEGAEDTESDDAEEKDDEEEDDAAKGAGLSDLEIEGSEEDLRKLHSVMSDNHLNVADVASLAEDVVKTNWGNLFEISLTRTTFADPVNRRFPLDTDAQVRAAMYYVRQDTTKALYGDDEVAYAKVVDAVDSAWKDKVGEMPEDLDKAVSENDLAKSFYLSAQFCGVLDSLTYLCQSAEYSYAEGARADLATKCKLAMKSLASCVAEMIQADVDSLNDPAIKAVADKLGKLAELTEVSEETVKKIGSRNSAADIRRIQGIHDLAVELGAKSPKTNPNGVLEDEADKAAQSEIEKLASNPALQKVLEAAIGKATAPLLQEIDTLKKRAAPAKGVLKVVSKGGAVEGTVGDDNKTPIDPVLKATGEVDEVATSIKALHKGGGAPLFTKN